MKPCIKRALTVAVACVFHMAMSSAHAAQVVVGQVAPLTGPEAGQGKAYEAGLRLVFNQVNRSGGVNGHTFSLVTKDDNGKPENTVALTRQLLSESAPMVLAGYFGSRNLAELTNAGLLEKNRLALVGYRSADVRAEPARLYNVRANLRDEIGKVTAHLGTQGISRWGVLVEDGPEAAEILAVTEALAKKGNASVVSKATYETGTSRLADAIDQFVADKPQAILLVCSGAAGARFIERYRGAGGAAQLYVHSGADMERVTRDIAASRLAFVTTVMQGVAISQVVPSPYKFSKLTKEFNDAVAKAKLEMPVNYVMLEGYIAAKTLVEAVRRQGANPTREGMAAAIEGIDNLDLGGYVLGFKPGQHTGSKFVELTIISNTGKIRQ